MISPYKINDSLDAAVLICELLQNLGELSEKNLLDILTLDETVSPFTISDALSLIEKKSMAEKTKDDLFRITVTGRRLAGELFERVPFSIRNSCLDEGIKIKKMIDLKKTVVWKIEKLTGGYYFKVNFLNEMGGDDIIDLKIYAPSYESALKMQENFLQNPIEAIERIMYIFIKE